MMPGLLLPAPVLLPPDSSSVDSDRTRVTTAMPPPPPALLLLALLLLAVRSRGEVVDAAADADEDVEVGRSAAATSCSI